MITSFCGPSVAAEKLDVIRHYCEELAIGLAELRDYFKAAPALSRRSASK